MAEIIKFRSFLFFLSFVVFIGNSAQMNDIFIDEQPLKREDVGGSFNGRTSFSAGKSGGFSLREDTNFDGGWHVGHDQAVTDRLEDDPDQEGFDGGWTTRDADDDAAVIGKIVSAYRKQQQQLAEVGNGRQVDQREDVSDLDAREDFGSFWPSIVEKNEQEEEEQPIPSRQRGNGGRNNRNLNRNERIRERMRRRRKGAKQQQQQQQQQQYEQQQREDSVGSDLSQNDPFEAERRGVANELPANFFRINPYIGGINEELRPSMTRKFTNRKGVTIGRASHMVNGVEVMSSKGAVYKNDGRKGMLLLRKPQKSLAGQITTETEMPEVDPAISAAACANYFGYSANTITKFKHNKIWYTKLGDTLPKLAHHVLVRGDYFDDFNQAMSYGIACFYLLIDREIVRGWRTTNMFVGDGGNLKAGKVRYGVDFPPLPVTQVNSDTCKMATADGFVVVFDNKNSTNVTVSSMTPDAVNGGYGPVNDCFYNARRTIDMLFDSYWGNMGSMSEVSSSGVINIVAHFRTLYENAVWSTLDNALFVGDGNSTYHPFCSCIDIMAHEIGHSATAVKSGLIYDGESGCINEAFSDMMGEAAENYAYGTNDWLVGRQCVKQGSAIRNMTIPATYDDYLSGKISKTDLHNCSSIFSHGFYRLSTLPSWDISKAFGLFLACNSAVWREETNMKDAWCSAVWVAFEISYGNAQADACDVLKIGESLGFACRNNPDAQPVAANCPP